MGRSCRVKPSVLVVSGAACLSILAATFLSSGSFFPKRDSPQVVFWAWERPEDLRHLAGQGEGVAFLARTIELRSLPSGFDLTRNEAHEHKWFDDRAAKLGVTLRPRLQPLHVGDETPLTAVVRIESSNDLWHRPEGQPERIIAAAPYTNEQREMAAGMAAAAAKLPRVKALQIDFDASQSERTFYAELLRDIRSRLPEGMPLSITALASWCAGDPWLDQLPPGTIDEAVPMLFRMGPGSMDVVAYVRSGREFSSRACRGSVGVSTDEEFSQGILQGRIRSQVMLGARRIYVFSPRAWTEQESAAVVREAGRWR